MKMSKRLILEERPARRHPELRIGRAIRGMKVRVA